MKRKGKSNRFYGFNALFSRKTVVGRMFFSYLVVGCLLITLFSSIVVGISSKRTEQQLVAADEEMLVRTRNLMETIFENTYTTYYDMYFNNSIVKNASRAESLDVEQRRLLFNELKDSINTDLNVDSVYFVSKKADLIVSSNGYARRIAEFPDTGLVDILDGYDTRQGKFIFPRLMSGGSEGLKRSANVLSFIVTGNTLKDEFETALIVNIKQEEIQKMMQATNLEKTRLFLVIDSAGNMIVSSDEKYREQTYGDIPFAKYVLSQPQTSETFRYEIDGVPSLVSYVKSADFGMTFICMNDYRQITGLSDPIIKSVLLGWLALSVCSLIIGLLFTTNFHGRIRLIMKETKGYTDSAANADGRRMDEFAYINHAIKNLKTEIKNSEQKVEDYSNIKRKEIMRDLLLGTVKVHDIKETVLIENTETCVVTVFQFSDFDAAMDVWSNEDLFALKYGIYNIAQEIMGEQYFGDWININNNISCAILNFDASSNAVIDKKLREIACNVEKYLGVRLIISVGRNVDDISEINNSYVTARKAGKYRIIFNNQPVIWYSKIESLERKGIKEYPYELEKQLFSAMNAQNMAGVESVLDEFVDQFRGLSYDNMVININQLALTTVRNLKRVDDSAGDNQALWEDLLSSSNRVDSYIDLNQIKITFKNIYQEIINSKKESSKQRMEGLTSNIIDYINENYSDPNLSIDAISESVNYSVSYVRQIFKNELNMTVHEYISELRLKKICELLVNTDLTVSEIGQKTGVISTGFFYTTFKNKTGYTPAQYRKKYKKD